MLEKNGITKITIALEGSDSESLLALPDLQNLNGKEIGLITAPGGRGVIEPSLIECGAKVHVCHVYRRKSIKISLKQIQRIEQVDLPFAVLCSSHEVFESFWHQISMRAQEKMKQLSFLLYSI